MWPESTGHTVAVSSCRRSQSHKIRPIGEEN
jgi:hypothetical protein